MDLASLLVFQTVARERSFSRAAEKLYRTQPAISISIRKLEDWVGQPLFVRGSGARTLTDAGVLLVEYADKMLNLREEISKGMKELRGVERGQLSLGANESSIHACFRRSTVTASFIPAFSSAFTGPSRGTCRAR
jgi:DNA-binding transcriptional LysR family regulator